MPRVCGSKRRTHELLKAEMQRILTLEMNKCPDVIFSIDPLLVSPLRVAFTKPIIQIGFNNMIRNWMAFPLMYSMIIVSTVFN